jgi:hypothetical protein
MDILIETTSYVNYYLSFDKSNMSSAFGWEGTACHFIIVNDDAVLSLSLSATNILHYQ